MCARAPHAAVDAIVPPPPPPPATSPTHQHQQLLFCINSSVFLFFFDYHKSTPAGGALCASRRSWCTLTLTNARADSPLVRLLLSMYIAQQSTNPVIKEMLVWGESGSPGPQHAEETGSRARTRAHTQTGRTGTQRKPFRPLSDHTDGPDRLAGRPTGDSPEVGASRSGSEGLPGVRAAGGGRERGERERERASERGGGGEREREAGKTEGREMCRFHDNKLR